MKAGIGKINHPEILTCGRSVRQGVSGEAAPLWLEAHATFLLPAPTAQERDVASDAPEASATESPGQCKASETARGGGKDGQGFGAETNTLDRAWGGK